MLQALLTGISLGLFAAVQPGVFQAFLLGETMRRGLAATLPLLIAPVLTDGPIAAFTLLVLAQTPPWLLAALELAGGAFVLWLALDAARGWRAAGAPPPAVAGSAHDRPDASPAMPAAPVADASTDRPAAVAHADRLAAGEGDPSALPFGRRLLRAMMVNGLNPGPWLFWAIVLGPLAVDAWREAPWQGVAVVGSFYVTLIAGFAGLVLLFGLAARRGRRVRRALQGVSALALVVFGVLLIGHGLGGFVGSEATAHAPAAPAGVPTALERASGPRLS